MRHVLRVAILLLGLGALVSCAAHTRATSPSVKEGFESEPINPAFWTCLRPENAFEITGEQARSGKSSLRLTIRKLPLFEHLQAPETILKAATTCMAALTKEEAKQYLNDESERAELRELKKQSPHFTDDIYYGFSLLIPRNSAPLGDFNRMVLAQWKLQREKPLPPDSPTYDSPFLAIRVTGGFFHIMLTVKAALKDDAAQAPSDCRVLLAFTQETPPNHASPLNLMDPERCESRLNYELNQGQPAPPKTLKINRMAYLPNPWDAHGKASWIDLIFHIKSGEKGEVDLWANGNLIAKATGWIGYEGIDHAEDLQYFKVGPYRDPAGYDTIIYLDNLARGHSYDEVDPGKF